MNYQELSEVGTLHVEYQGPQLDARSLGMLETQLHSIAEKVAIRTLLEDQRGLFALLDHPGFVSEYSWRRRRKSWPKMFDPFFLEMFPFRRELLEESLRQLPIVRLRSENIRSGSLYQDLTLYLAEVLSNPDTRAVLQSFGGNLLYSVYQSGLRGVEYVQGSFHQREAAPVFDPYDVGDNVRKIVAELIANGNGEASKVTIKHKIKDGESQVQIQIQ